MDDYAYPDWFTELDKERIMDAIARHAPDYLPPHDGGAIVFFQFYYSSDAAAQAAVLAVLQVVAEVLTRHPDHAAEWPAVARRLRDARLVDVDRVRQKTTSRWPTREAFVAAIEQSLAQQPWWSSAPAGAPTQTLLTAVNNTSRATRVRETFPKRAEWLQPYMRDKHGKHLSDYMFHKLFGGPDPKVMKKIHKGEPVTDDVLMTLVDALQAAGHRVTFNQIPRE